MGGPPPATSFAFTNSIEPRTPMVIKSPLDNDALAEPIVVWTLVVIVSDTGKTFVTTRVEFR